MVADEKEKVRQLLLRLRRVTIAVEAIPFIYGFAYIVALICYLSGNDSLQFVMDELFYVSPLFVLCLLWLSCLLKLCKWHKIACCVPLLIQVDVFAGFFLCDFSNAQKCVHILITLLILVTLLFSCYKIFFPKWSRQSCYLKS